MERVEKIALIDNELEGIRLQFELDEREIPHIIRSYHDLAYDGLFQFSRGGWGHVEAPARYGSQILEILTDLRATGPVSDEEAEKSPKPSP